MFIRKATLDDLAEIIRIYDEIHDREEAGEVTTGWLRDIYPTRKTAESSIERGDMFVQENEAGEIVGPESLIKHRSMFMRMVTGSFRRRMRKSWCSIL